LHLGKGVGRSRANRLIILAPSPVRPAGSEFSPDLPVERRQFAVDRQGRPLLGGVDTVFQFRQPNRHGPVECIFHDIRSVCSRGYSKCGAMAGNFCLPSDGMSPGAMTPAGCVRACSLRGCKARRARTGTGKKTRGAFCRSVNPQIGQDALGRLPALPDGGDHQVGAAHHVAAGKNFGVAGLQRILA